jgi:hypothetical protein
MRNRGEIVYETSKQQFDPVLSLGLDNLLFAVPLYSYLPVINVFLNLGDLHSPGGGVGGQV